MRASIAGLFVLLAAAAPVRALELAAVFGEGMVLQRDGPIRVWGSAEPGEKVSVSLAGKSARAEADGAGRFEVELPALRRGGPYVLHVRGSRGDKLAVADVLVGDVWVCSGQSNMAWTVAASRDGPAECAAADHAAMRLLTVPRVAAAAPKTELAAKWVRCTPVTVRAFSGVAYFFGRELLREVKVPIGLINTCVGGTVVEAWSPRAALQAEGSFGELLGRWDPAKPGVDPAHRNAPGALYNAMVAPLVPLSVRGVIWYQGESNAGRAEQYGRLFPTLIRAWRDVFRAPELPFLFVQLANFQARAEAPGPSAWAELRDAQRRTLSLLPGTGMAVAIDIGEAGDIHPRNKQEVGRRLALLALAGTYRQDVVPCGPLYRSCERRGERLVLSFAHAEGLATSDGAVPAGFTVAGEDGVFHAATAEIRRETVEVWCAEVPEPVAARYGWANNPEVNLVNGAGLPASPFRTDDWPGITAGKE